MEAVTDPDITPGSTRMTRRSLRSAWISGCVQIGSMSFQVQSEYSNAIHGCTR